MLRRWWSKDKNFLLNKKNEIYSRNILLATKEKNNLVNKWASELNKYFSNEEVEMANKHT
jgi:hypothetical protein